MSAEDWEELRGGVACIGSELDEFSNARYDAEAALERIRAEHVALITVARAATAFLELAPMYSPDRADDRELAGAVAAYEALRE